MLPPDLFPVCLQSASGREGTGRWGLLAPRRGVCRMWEVCAGGKGPGRGGSSGVGGERWPDSAAHLWFFMLPFACPAPSELRFASSGWSRLLSLPVTAAGEYVVGGM